MNKQAKKILILGASGFLGKNLAEGLSANFDVLAPARAELDLLNAAAIEAYLQAHRPNCVVHAAALGVNRGENADPAVASQNLKMFFNLAACQKYFKKMIFCGSGAVYDKRRDLVRVKEEDFGKSVPVDPYGAYKYECSKYIEQSENIVDLRMFGVFGEYEDYATRFISNAICRLLLNMPLVIRQNVKFDYLYVNDFVRIVKYFLTGSFKYKAYNVGTGEPADLLTIVKKLESISGLQAQIRINKVGWNKEYTCDNARLMAEIPDFVFTSLDSALFGLYNWYKERLGAIDEEKLLIERNRS
jgi:GDP-L-fucose synthase